MWCCHCRCEVAAEPSAGAGETRCAECQTTCPDHDLKASPATDAATSGAELASCTPQLQRLLEDFELADDLRRARRLLRLDQAQHDQQPLGLAALLADEPTSGKAAKQGRRRRPGRRKQADRSLAASLWGAATWLIVCAGGMGLTFGAGLMACTQFLHTHLLRDGLARRDDLWTWGLLTALAGQFLLFLGFACRWSSGRAATASQASRRAKPEKATAPRTSPTSTLAPLWSARCEAVLGLPLDALDCS